MKKHISRKHRAPILISGPLRVTLRPLEAEVSVVCSGRPLLGSWKIQGVSEADLWNKLARKLRRTLPLRLRPMLREFYEERARIVLREGATFTWDLGTLAGQGMPSLQLNSCAVDDVTIAVDIETCAP